MRFLQCFLDFLEDFFITIYNLDVDILLPLSITLAIETGIYMILKHKDLKLFIVVSLMNLILNPSMNIGLHFIKDDATYWILLTIFEVLTIAIESVVLKLFMKFHYLPCLLFSIHSNVISFGIGMLLFPVYEMKITPIILSVIFLLIYLVTFGVVLFSAMRSHAKGNDDARCAK